MGARFTVFRAKWLALLLIKSVDIETNPGPTTSHKQVWICNICHKQIHGRKQISISCNRIEHRVHLRCACIRLAQYTDTWTCHLHKESGFTTHTDITPPYPFRPWSKTPAHSSHTPHTPPQPINKHTPNTPHVPTGLINTKPNSPPLSSYAAHTYFKHSTNSTQLMHHSHP